MSTFYLSLGSNLGDRLENLKSGIEELKNARCDVTAISSVYETEAIGIEGAPDFLNVCILGETPLTAFELMRALLSIEQKCGRQRHGNETSSRTLDMDIILFDDLVLDAADLKLPHPRYTGRKFVLEPLLELTPDLIDPKEMKPVSEILVHSSDSSVVKKLEISLFA